MTRPPRLDWRLIVTPPAAGAWNMAVDEALMESVRAGARPALRLYGWSPPCISLGRNQPLGPFAAFGSAGDLDLVRRLTGGRAVLHDRELTYAAVLPARALGGPRVAYREIGEALRDAVTMLGARASLHQAPAGSAPPPSTAPCFADPADGELLVGHRKLIGSAQVRLGNVLLQHGSIPLEPSPLLDRLSEALPANGAPAYLNHACGRPVDAETLTAAIADAWERRIGRPEDSELTPSERASAAAYADRYSSPDWLARRRPAAAVGLESRA